MPTDYACQAAAERAARGIAPVRALVVPVRRRPVQPQQPDLPVVLRTYLGMPAQAENKDPENQDTTAPPAVSSLMGASVLLVILEGLKADMAGSLSEWHSGLSLRLPQAMGAPVAGKPKTSSGRQSGGWQVMADLQKSAREVLTDLAGRSRGGSAGMGVLNVQLVMIEDLLSGTLRRLDIPVETAAHCAGELVVAAGSLFGLSARLPPTAPSAPSGEPAAQRD
ncbi:MAG TPA: hypothetical protein DEQ61_10630 [Streptomyces sp.]|nr:hypothetical protein [Streptomyces sp.]